MACEECDRLKKDLSDASIEFAYEQSRLQGRIPPIIDKTAPLFLASRKRDEAHQKLVDHLIDHDD